MKIKIDNEHILTINCALIDYQNKMLDKLVEHPDSKYYLDQVLIARKAKSAIIESLENIKEE